MATNRNIHTILVFSSSILLTACASSTVSSNTIPENGLTVSQIYQQSMGESMPRWSAQQTAKHVNYDGYTRNAANEVNLLFKPLDNPQIPIYVFPHVALIGDEQLIKPGYSTGFFLYKQNQFALASELY